MDTDQLSGFQALREWRQGLLDAGVPADSLPLEADLERITRSPNPETFAMIGLIRLDAVRSFQPGILNAVRSATRAVAAGQPTAPADPTPAGSTTPPQAQASTAPSPPARHAAPEPTPVGSSRRSRAAATARSAAAAAVDERPTETVVSPPEPTEPVAFAPRDRNAAADEPITTLRSQVGADGELTIRWAGIEDEPDCVLYRVVTSNGYMPFSPETGELLTVTGGTQVVDRRPFTGALRHIQVWVNRGLSETAARLSQPVLLCQGTVVAPVRNVDLREDQGSVSCAWDPVPADISRVEVLRIPEAEADRPGYQRRYLMTAGQECRTGFQDTACQPGATYEYRFFTVAMVAGRETMSQVARRIRISAPLRPVQDLHAVARAVEHGTVVDLTWSDVGAAHIDIYRTDVGPEPGADDVAIPLTALASARLPDTARLNQPVQTVDTASRMNAVAWPADLARVYFTPVSRDGGMVFIGATQVLTRAGETRDVTLVQRVDWQLLTFGWPEGASQVQVFITAKGIPLADAPGEPVAQLGRVAYETHGGLRLRGVLPDNGCDVHVVPATFYGGQITRGPAFTIGYGGIVRLKYRLETESNLRSRVFGGRRRRVLEVYSEQLVSTPALILVHHTDRLPLDARDAGGSRPRTIAATSVERGQWTVIDRFETDPDKPGYFRVFAEIDPTFPAEFAVLDPPLRSLRGGL